MSVSFSLGRVMVVPQKAVTPHLAREALIRSILLTVPSEKSPPPRPCI